MYKIELTEEQLRVISEALGNAPFRVSAPVISELQKQLADQKPKLNGSGKKEESAQAVQ